MSLTVNTAQLLQLAVYMSYQQPALLKAEVSVSELSWSVPVRLGAYLSFVSVLIRVFYYAAASAEERLLGDNMAS